MTSYKEMRMYLDLHKVPTFVMLVKEPFSLTMLKKQEKNDVGDDAMDLYRLN